MLKHVLAASAAVAALAALSAPAYAVDGHITITASVAATCVMSTPDHTVDLGALSMTTSGTHSGGQTSTQGFGDMWCNGSHNTLSVIAHPLIGANTTADPSFTNRVDYTLTSAVLPGTSLDTAGADAGTGAPTSVPNVPAFDTGSGTFDQYTITTDAGAKKLTAGAYSGIVDVTLTPGL